MYSMNINVGKVRHGLLHLFQTAKAPRVIRVQKTSAVHCCCNNICIILYSEWTDEFIEAHRLCIHITYNIHAYEHKYITCVCFVCFSNDSDKIPGFFFFFFLYINFLNVLYFFVIYCHALRNNDVADEYTTLRPR